MTKIEQSILLARNNLRVQLEAFGYELASHIETSEPTVRLRSLEFQFSNLRLNFDLTVAEVEKDTLKANLDALVKAYSPLTRSGYSVSSWSGITVDVSGL